MRIGTSAFFRNMTRTLARTQRELGDLTVRMSLGLRVRKPSDDPLAGLIIARAHTELRASTSRSSLIERALWTTQAVDGALGELSQALQGAITSALRATESGRQTAATRAGLAIEVRAAREAALSAVNARHGDRYLFAGYQDRAVPFVENAVGMVEYRGDTGQITVPVAGGRTCPISVPGDQLVNMPGGSRDLFTLLADLAQAIEEGDQNTTVALRDELMAMHAHIVEQRGSVGAWTVRLEASRRALEDAQMRCQEILNAEETLDLAEGLSEYASRETTYQAILNVFARILALPTVFDLTR